MKFAKPTMPFSQRISFVALIFIAAYILVEGSKLSTQRSDPRRNGEELRSRNVNHELSKQKSKISCGEDQVFHNGTQRCYYRSNAPIAYIHPENVTTPCGELMYLYQVSSDSPYGVCGCMTDDNCRYSVEFNRPVLNWPGKNRCYFAYDQGPCENGEWIVMNKKTFQSECQKNPCAGRPLQKISQELRLAYSQASDIFWFVKNGSCHQTFTQAYCKPGEYVRFLRTHPVPFCTPVDSGFGCGAVGTTAMLPCPQGHKRVGDECSPIADFE